jgi:hypothetical protein
MDEVCFKEVSGMCSDCLIFCLFSDQGHRVHGCGGSIASL